MSVFITMTNSQKRRLFLGISGCVAIAVGLVAMLFADSFLILKGVTPLAATALWMRETGLLLVSVGVINMSARNLPCQ